MVYFTWRLVARVFLKVNKRCDMWKEKGELSASRVSCTSCQRLREKKKREREKKRRKIAEGVKAAGCEDEQRESDERGSAG